MIIPHSWIDNAKTEILNIIDNVIVNNVPEGHYKPVNFYVDSDTGRLAVDYDDTPTE